MPTTESSTSVSLIVAKVGGIVPLVRLLRDGSPAGQQQAVCAIAEVGLLPENRQSKISQTVHVRVLTNKANQG